MFRKEAVLQAGGYRGVIGTGTEAGYCPCEDYSLWQRMLALHPFCIANIPDLGIVLRQHSTRCVHTCVHTCVQS